MGGADQHFLIRGLLVGPELTILEINGPWYDTGVPPTASAAILHIGTNLDKLWVRKS